MNSNKQDHQGRKSDYLNSDLSTSLGISSRVEKITPDIARKYLLKRSPSQRKISPATVQRYVNDLTSGTWEMNGEPIVFSKDGTLLNGNHRLTAIIKSGKPMTTLVVYGIDDNVSIYDVQKKRTAKDVASINEIELAPTALTAAKNLVGMFKPFGDGVLNKYIKTHNGELRRAYNACCRGEHGRSGKRAGCVLACYLMLRTQTAQYYELEAFFDIYNDRTAAVDDGYVTSPAIMAREMIETMNPMQPRRSRCQLEIIIQALEDFIARRERTTPYVIKSDMEMHWEKYAKLVRVEDGLEDD